MNPDEPTKIESRLWKRLTAWFRQNTVGDDSAPLGFATRVVARYQELRRNERFRAWERLSIRTAIGCAAFATIFGLFSILADRNAAADSVLIEPPADFSAEFVGFEFEP